MDGRARFSRQLYPLFGLHRSWTRRYAFHNLNALLNGPPDLDPVALARSLRRYRGGYCHELNSAFKAQLESRDIETTPYLAKVMYRSAGRVLSPSHLYLLARVSKRLVLCDVGFGNGLLWPIELDTPDERRQSALSFQLRTSDRDRGLWIRERGQWDELYRLAEEPCHQEHLKIANHYSASSPESLFSSNVALTCYVCGGRRRLLNRRYVDEAQKTVLLDSRSAFGACLHDHFDLRLTTNEVGHLFGIASKVPQ